MHQIENRATIQKIGALIHVEAAYAMHLFVLQKVLANAPIHQNTSEKGFFSWKKEDWLL